MSSSSDDSEWEDPDPFGFNAELDQLLEAASVARQAGGAQAGGT